MGSSHDTISSLHQVPSCMIHGGGFPVSLNVVSLADGDY